MRRILTLYFTLSLLLVFITTILLGAPLKNRRIRLQFLSSTKSVISQTKPASQEIIIIRFGRNGQIKYQLKTGTADMLQGNSLIIQSAFAAVRQGHTTISSKEFTSRTYKKINFTDQLGSGQKHIFTLRKAGLPELQQVFYTYPTKEYFLMNILLNGKNLSSNYMAPLISESVNLTANGDNRMLFVPFDNDTFIRYNAQPMDNKLSSTSAEVGVIYENTTRKGLVIGSVEHTVWKTRIKTTGQKNKLSELVAWGGYTDEKVTRDKVAHGIIQGDTLKSPKLLVGYFDDWRHGLEEYGKVNRLAEPPYLFSWTKPTPFGWNSWGVIQDKISLDKALSVTNFFADSLKDFRSDNTAFIDLDSYWDNLLIGGLEGDYSKLKQFAEDCKSKGLQPGVYWAPFIDWGWKSTKPRRVEGSNYQYPDIWTKLKGGYHDLDGGRALDPTHPGTRQRLALVINKLKECGFKMIKIDFLGHAAIESDQFYDTTVTTGMQAYRSGMEYLIDQLDNQMLVYAAISPSLATGRYAHTRRIACDAMKTIKDTQYTLNSLNYGWWQTYLYNFIDADHLVLGSEALGVNRARITSGLITGTLFTGDDYATTGPWAARSKTMLQNPLLLEIARHGKAFRPVEGNTGENTTNLFVSTFGQDYYLAILNYGETMQTFTIDFKRLGLPVNAKASALELFSNQKKTVNKNLSVEMKGRDAAIYKIQVRK